MKTQLIAAFMLLFWFTYSHAQITFQRVYGTSDNEQCETIEQTNDGGYILAGEATYQPNPHQGLLVKVNSTGNISWARIFTIPYHLNFNCVRQTPDSGYIIAGSTNALSNLLLLKTDIAGNLLWAKSYGDSSNEVGYYVINTTDGGFIALGSTNAGGNVDIYLIKTDALGNLLWARNYGGSGYDIAYRIRQTSDGGYIISGASSSFGAGNSEIYRIKINGYGDIMWSKIYGGAYSNGGGDALETADGGFFMLGHSGYGPSNAVNVQLIRTNSTGDTIWTKTYGKPGTHALIMQRIDITSNGDYIMTGWLETIPGQYDGYLMKVDSMANNKWSYSFSSSQGFGSVHETIDGGLVLFTTYSGPLGPGGNDFFLVKTDSSGNSGCYQSADTLTQSHSPIVISNPLTLVDSGAIENNVNLIVSNVTLQDSILCFNSLNSVPDEEITSNEIAMFPNPSNGSFTIQGLNGTGELIVYSPSGSEIYRKKINSKFETVEINGTYQGIYFLQVILNKETATKIIWLYQK